MPNGKNGIHLVIMQNGKEIIEKMSVDIEEKVAQWYLNVSEFLQLVENKRDLEAWAFDSHME